MKKAPSSTIKGTCSLFTARQRSCGKVMFLHEFVCHSMVSLDPCPFWAWVSLVPDHFQGLGMSRGLVCLGVDMGYGNSRGVGTHPLDVGPQREWGTHPYPQTWDTMVYGQQAGGTHPTGMLSWLVMHISMWTHEIK